MTNILLLISGGLDSLLAAKILQNAGAEVTGITFISAFFDSTKAETAANKIGIRLIIENITDQHLEIVKNPPSGHGKNLNPCIDCHALMFKTASEIAIKKRFDGIATGEVLGQRPFSQNKNAFARIEKITALQNKILRPLSAKLLPETEIEQKGLIDREKLEDIQGRSRNRQFELAKKFDISKYPTPAGGCILTDPGYSKRGRELLEINPDAGVDDFAIIKYGRFFINNKSMIIVGRHKEDNQKLRELALDTDILIKMSNYPGPVALIRNFRGNDTEKLKKFACEKVKYMSTKSRRMRDVEFEEIKVNN